MGSDYCRCNRCCRPDSRSPCFRCWNGLLGRIPVEQFRRIGQHIPNRHRYLSDCRRHARLVGGFIAGRLRTKWVGVHEHEVFFRDTAHGFLAWGLATVLSAAFLASAASNIAGVASSAPASGGPVDYYVDALLRSNPGASQNTTDMEATRREIARILVTGFRIGDVLASDRTIWRKS
jgi:hypothetical protein